MENPLLSLGTVLAFDRVRAEHVVPGLSELIRRTERALDAIEANAAEPSYEATLGALERATEELELAVAIDTTPQTISLWENGMLPDSLLLLERLAQDGADIHWLLSGTPRRAA